MKTLFCLSATILFLALFNSAAFGATKVSAKSGSYGFASTWTDGIAPVTGGTLNGTPILGNCGQVGIKAP